MAQFLYVQMKEGSPLAICKGELENPNDDPHSFAKMMRKSGVKVFLGNEEVGKNPPGTKGSGNGPDQIYSPVKIADLDAKCITKE